MWPLGFGVARGGEVPFGPVRVGEGTVVADTAVEPQVPVPSPEAEPGRRVVGTQVPSLPGPHEGRGCGAERVCRPGPPEGDGMGRPC